MMEQNSQKETTSRILKICLFVFVALLILFFIQVAIDDVLPITEGKLEKITDEQIAHHDRFWLLWPNSKSI